MGKDKKTKPGKREEKLEDDVVKQFETLDLEEQNEKAGNKTNKNAKSNKKQNKKGKDDISSEESESEVLQDFKSKKQLNKKKKGGSPEQEEMDSKLSKGDGAVGEDGVSLKQKDKKEKVAKGKAKKGSNSGDNNTSEKLSKQKSAEDFDDEEEESVIRSKSSKKMSAFQLLEVEDMDIDIDIDDESDEEKVEKVSDKPRKKSKAAEDDLEEEETKKKGEKVGKKQKRKERRKQQEDEEDVDRLLEELALEIEGKKPLPDKEKSVEKVPLPEGGEQMEVEVEEITKKKKKKKNKEDQEIAEKKEEEAEAQEGEEGILKTAAQKRKEKKERERLKKLQQNAQEKTKKVKEEQPLTDDSSSAVKTEKESSPVEAGEELTAEPESKADEDEDEGKKKKKKKKKGEKGEEEEKKDKKRPGKKQIAQMQEALKKLQEEQERLKLEEEAKRRAEEEAERQRLEKLRLEQERKERKKQKEKERRERLKAEGKLMTAAQKQRLARAQATLQKLREQGIEVPLIGEKKERAPRLGDRRKPSKKKTDQEPDQVSTPQEEVPPKVEVAIVEAEDSAECKAEPETPKDEIKESWEDEEDGVKETWDDSQDEEDAKSKMHIDVKIGKNEEKAAKKEDSEEEEDEDESEEETEEESEEESEEETETEEESSEEDEKQKQEQKMEKVRARIRQRREDAESKRTIDKLRSPVVCVLGHVDTGKTKILDKIRNTHVQDGEAGGITQQIGATMVPQDAIKDQCKMAKSFAGIDLKIPGLLIIDTPGHESFSNLRSRGSSLCDIAILVVDIMHGLEPQTLESITLLKQKKTPFVVALNKIDRLYDWKSNRNKDVQDVIKSQQRNTKLEFEERVKEVILQFAEQALNAALFYENKDPRTYISLVPTSAATGEGVGNLISLIVELTQSMMVKRLSFSTELQATILEVKAIPGLGTTVDAILVNGTLREGDTIVLAGHEGAIVTQIRSLLMPQPLKELRVKNPYQEFKEVEGAQGVKIAAKELDKAIAGLPLLIAHHPDEVPILKEEVETLLQSAMSAIKTSDRGVYVQASTLGSLEALLEFLKASKIPYFKIRVGPVAKRDVTLASTMLEHDPQYAVILAFDVKVDRDAQELADSVGVKIFQADIIYHLFDKFMAYREELHQKKREEFKHVAVFPCKLRILPQFIFNSRDPIVVGVSVEAGVLKEGTPLCVPSREFLDIGTVSTIEINHKPIDLARKGQEVCIKIEPLGGESPKMYGRHFDHTDLLVSKISRQSIDACKDYFREDLVKADWQLMVELKKLFQIM